MLPPSLGHHERLDINTRTSFEGRPILLLSAQLRPLVHGLECPSHLWMLQVALKPGGPALEPSAMPLLGAPYRRVAGKRDPLKDQKIER